MRPAANPADDGPEDRLEDKLVAVAGATGLLGSHVVEELVRRGARVRASVHRRSPPPAGAGVLYESVDLSNAADAQRFVDGVSRLYLCAGIVGGAGLILSDITPATQLLVLNAQLLEAACAAKVERIGLVSSTTVYPMASHPMHEDEGFADEPFTAYRGLGWANRALEKVAQVIVERGRAKVAIIRPTTIYGPQDRFDAGAHVLPALIRRACIGEDPFIVWGDGMAVRDFVSAVDVAHALVDAVEQAADAVPINIGSGIGVTIAQAVDAVLEAVGHRPSELRYDSSKPTTIPVRLVDLSRAKERIGFAPRVALADGLRATVDWYRSVPKA